MLLKTIIQNAVITLDLRVNLISKAITTCIKSTYKNRKYSNIELDLGVKTFYVDGNIINDKTITINTKILYGNYCGDTCLPGYAYYLTVPFEGSTPIFVSDDEGEFIVTEEKYNEISSKIPITTFTFERDDLGNYGLKSVKIK